MSARRHTLVFLVLVTFAVGAIGCKKQTKKLTWTPPPDRSLLAPESDDELLETQLREALVTLKRVHFALDSTELTAQSREALEEAREKLGDRDDVHLYVEGHADSQGSTEYNIGLAEDRATVVCDYLARLGMSPDRLHVVSWGEEKPLVEGNDERAHAMNRRVDFKVMKGNVEIILEEGVTIAAR